MPPRKRRGMPAEQRRAWLAQLTPGYIFANEAAILARVRPARVYGAIRGGTLPGFVRIGRQHRGTIVAVHAWVAAGCP